LQALRSISFANPKAAPLKVAELKCFTTKYCCDSAFNPNALCVPWRAFVLNLSGVKYYQDSADSDREWCIPVLSSIPCWFLLQHSLDFWENLLEQSTARKAAAHRASQLHAAHVTHLQQKVTSWQQRLLALGSSTGATSSAKINMADLKPGSSSTAVKTPTEAEATEASAAAEAEAVRRGTVPSLSHEAKPAAAALPLRTPSTPVTEAPAYRSSLIAASLVSQAPSSAAAEGLESTTSPLEASQPPSQSPKSTSAAAAAVSTSISGTATLQPPPLSASGVDKATVHAQLPTQNLSQEPLDPTVQPPPPSASAGQLFSSLAQALAFAVSALVTGSAAEPAKATSATAMRGSEGPVLQQGQGVHLPEVALAARTASAKFAEEGREPVDPFCSFVEENGASEELFTAKQGEDSFSPSSSSYRERNSSNGAGNSSSDPSQSQGSGTCSSSLNITSSRSSSYNPWHWFCQARLEQAQELLLQAQVQHTAAQEGLALWIQAESVGRQQVRAKMPVGTFFNDK
jgi:hypothetical protein